MRGSYKKRLARRKARENRRINGHRKNRKTLYRFAIHEVGHYVVKSKLCPDIPLALELKRSHGQLLGTVINLNDPKGLDPYDVMIKVAIAGVIFEMYHLQRQSESLMLLVNTIALRGDWDKFVKAKAELSRNNSRGHDYVMENINGCFNSLQPKIIEYLEEYGWVQVKRLAWRLVRERKIIMPSIGRATDSSVKKRLTYDTTQ